LPGAGLLAFIQERDVTDNKGRFDAEAHRKAVHERWTRVLNRSLDDSNVPDEWYAQQCLHCRYYVPLSTLLGEDHGACTNASSPMDRTVMFEHDGCDHFVAGDDS
jgi:hypothetical protein